MVAQGRRVALLPHNKKQKNSTTAQYVELHKSLCGASSQWKHELREINSIWFPGWEIEEEAEGGEDKDDGGKKGEIEREGLREDRGG